MQGIEREALKEKYSLFRKGETRSATKDTSCVAAVTDAYVHLDENI